MPKPTKAQVREALESSRLSFDHLVHHRSGAFSVKSSYFYRHGRMAGGYAKELLKALPQAEVVEAFDDYHDWPRTSYLVVRFTVESL